MENRTELISIRVTPLMKKNLVAEAKEFGQKTVAGYCLSFLEGRTEVVCRRRDLNRRMSEV